MSHSVTGGALVAQGYWMPYSCARAICLTFAYPIRWALTPIFGPSFIRECLQPNTPGFARFKIDSETVRCAQMAMEGLRNGEQEDKDTPRTLPDMDAHVPCSGAIKPTFKLGSPFDSHSEVSNGSKNYRLAIPSALNSPAISPKTSTFEMSGWTSINQYANGNRNAPPPPPPNTPYSSLDSSLLTEPSNNSWRPAQNADAGTTSPATASAKRARHGSFDEDYSDSASTSTSDGSSENESESDYVALDVYSKPTLRGHGHRKINTALQQGRGGRPYTAVSRSATSTPPLKKSKKYTAEDFRAARLLLELSQGDGGSLVGKGKGRMW